MKLRVGLILTTMVLGGMLLSGVVLAKNLTGGPGNNNYIGGNGTDTLKGGGGADDIDGKEGLDYLFGDGGSDRLHGGRGDDEIDGGPGPDTAWGEKGKDRIWAAREVKGTYGKASIQAAKGKGGRKPDKLLGGRSNDTIRAKNGKKDIIRGGPGYDKAYVDRVDKVKGVEVERCGGGGCTKPPGDGNKKPPVNKPPAAKNDSYSVYADHDLKVPPPGVLDNDQDADGDSLTAVLVDGPSGGYPGSPGDLTLYPDGSFTYSPDYDHPRSESFTYKATDGVADSSKAAQVNITVCYLNDSPPPAGCPPP